MPRELNLLSPARVWIKSNKLSAAKWSFFLHRRKTEIVGTAWRLKWSWHNKRRCERCRSWSPCRKVSKRAIKAADDFDVRRNQLCNRNHGSFSFNLLQFKSNSGLFFPRMSRQARKKCNDDWIFALIESLKWSLLVSLKWFLLAIFQAALQMMQV